VSETTTWSEVGAAPANANRGARLNSARASPHFSSIFGKKAPKGRASELARAEQADITLGVKAFL